MSRYYFILSNGKQIIRDREGVELAGLLEVQDEVFAFGRKVLKHRFSYGIDDPALWTIQVTNEDHRVLAKLPLKEIRRLQRQAA